MKCFGGMLAFEVNGGINEATTFVEVIRIQLDCIAVYTCTPNCKIIVRCKIKTFKRVLGNNSLPIAGILSVGPLITFLQLHYLKDNNLPKPYMYLTI
jgi:hypothetical protein